MSKKHFFHLALLVLCLVFSSENLYSGQKGFQQNRKNLLVRPHDNFVNAGMFATCNLVLGHLYLFDIGCYNKDIDGLKVDFGKKGNYYDPKRGSNWWRYYFEPLEIKNSIKSKLKVTSPDQNRNAWDKRKTLSREQANALIKKYIKIRPSIKKNVKEFAREKFKDYFMIGVHYRGTDKAKEADPVSYDDALEVIEEYIDTLPKKTKFKIFIATDEVGFLEYMKSCYPKRIIAIEAFRSENSDPVHHSDNDSYLLGEQAIMDSLLLSKCDVLIRTSSSLSLWSTYFNPKVPVIMLNERRNGPE